MLRECFTRAVAGKDVAAASQGLQRLSVNRAAVLLPDGLAREKGGKPMCAQLCEDQCLVVRAAALRIQIVDS